MVLLNFKQEVPGDHVPPEEVLKALNIEEPVPKLAEEVASSAPTDAQGSASASQATQ